MTCGEAIVKLLEAYGVDLIFGIPGVHNLELYRGLADSDIRHILARHEQGAGFMADGYARASGKPGVCFVISGPGITNIATPMGQAYSDSIPMLVISSDAPKETLGKGWGYLHEVSDLTAVTSPLTAFSASVNHPDELPELMAKAFDVFTTKRPRPVHLVIPLDVLAMPVTENWTPKASQKPTSPSQADIEKVAQLLQEARQVVIIAGGGASRSGASSQVIELAERLNAPVAMTSSGKGIIPDAHPLCLGSVIYQEVQAYISKADMVLALGTELADTDCFAGHYKFKGKLIHIDIDPTKMGDYFETELGIVADIRESLEQLLGYVSPNSGNVNGVQGTRAKISEGLSRLEREHQTLLLALREALKDDAMITADMTQIAYSAVGLLPMPKPNCWFNPTGYGTLGYAFPAALGARFAAPKRDLAVLVGDAGFQYTLHELGTAVEHKLALAIILWNNGGLGEIERSMQAVGIQPTQVKPHNPDFQALAKAYGADAVLAENRDGFTESVRKSQSEDRPTLIEVRQGSSWLL